MVMAAVISFQKVYGYLGGILLPQGDHGAPKVKGRSLSAFFTQDAGNLCTGKKPELRQSAGGGDGIRYLYENRFFAGFELI